MEQYTLAFVFTPDLDYVWLIEKQKPEWQKGSLNGIGGKLERGEQPLKGIIREVKEEAGINIPGISYVGNLFKDYDFEVYVFASISKDPLIAQEVEEIDYYPVDDIIKGKYTTIENIPALVALCRTMLQQKQATFKKFLLKY